MSSIDKMLITCCVVKRRSVAVGEGRRARAEGGPDGTHINDLHAYLCALFAENRR